MKQTAPSSILALHEISLYNTGRVAPEKIIAAFAARRDQFQRIVADLAAEKPTSRAQHHLIVGQRGMGKTMLLARLAAELRTEPALRERFVPLVFAEEQYAVDRLSKFWLNCLDSLADAREADNQTEAVEAIDATVKRLTSGGFSAPKDDQLFADEVYAAFAAAAQTSGQRPVLLVDNLQLVFERLESGQQHSLRELLTRPGAPILVGASPSPPPQSQDYGAAFYDHFKVHYLRPLEEAEMRDLLLHLAAAAQRDDVRQRVLQHPARLKVLRQLTGGNPRTTLTLFLLYAEDFAPSVFGDLEGLLDRVTPLYKARFEELTPQQQVITSAIANHWDPITAAALAANTGLPAGTISAQLDRLEKTGVIERTELFGESRTGYMIAERFFNIWFLMRSASRRQRREVEFLTRFLENFYEPSDRSRIARHLMAEDGFSPDRYLWSRAVADSLRDEPHTAEDLKRHAELTALREEAREARARLHEIIDFSQLPPATLAFDDLRKKLMSLVPEAGETDPETFAKAVLGDRALFMSGEREKLAARSGKLETAEIEAILKAIAASRASDIQRYHEESVDWFSNRLATGQIRSRDDAEDWNRTILQTGEATCLQMLVDSLPNDFGAQLSDAALDRIREKLTPGPDAPSWQFVNWGNDLRFKLSRYDESETAYHEAITRDPNSEHAWHNLGSLLESHFLRHADAEAAFRKAIDINPRYALSWIGLGILLGSTKQRFSEAETAFQEAISINPKDATPWFFLGNLLKDNLHRYSEADAAYREAIARDSRSAWTWIELGTLLQDKLKRFSEAGTAFQEAISCAPKLAVLLVKFGIIPEEHLRRHPEAESILRDAVALDPKNSALWSCLGSLYCDYLHRPADAASAFESALKLRPTNESAHQNYLFLQRDFLGKGPAARPLMTDLMALLEHQFPDTTHLHEALFAAYDDNWGLAREALTQAIELRSDGFSPNTTDDWLRTSAVLIHLNYGDELIAFVDGLGDTAARLRPWVEALRALQIGDRQALRNIAPEIRATAEIFYDGIERRLNHLPEKTRRRPLPKPPRSRSRKK
ncbi:MAG: tetratricopeptide repeat protein [Verrucomicrobiales bacterium]|nr:tetratricopeptide repeat protein [Verrucomicrobiales bacterium]